MLFGGPRLPRALAYVVACLTRASTQTLAGFKDQHKALVNAVFKNELSTASPGHSDEAIPDGRSSAAFCSNLLAARSGDSASFLLLALNQVFWRSRGSLSGNNLNMICRHLFMSSFLPQLPLLLRKSLHEIGSP